MELIKNAILYSLSLVALYTGFTASHSTCSCYAEVFSIIDSRIEQFPKKFRTPHQEIKEKEVTLDGFRELSTSASGQFSEGGLIKIVDKISYPSEDIVIVDLREESHGYINGIGVSWTDGEYNQANLNKPLEEIILDEKNRIEKAFTTGSIVLTTKEDRTASEVLVVTSAVTERELVESLGMTYYRLPVTDHCRPSDQVVDEFIQIMESLPENKWVHFHCRGGVGRATTFLTLYDIYSNASKIAVDELSLEDILVRQTLIGGKDLMKVDRNSYKYELALQRLEFLKNFYLYSRQDPAYSQKWSEWIAKQNTTRP